MTALFDLRQAERVYSNGVQTIALRPTTLTIERGEFVVILGPSGSGKSTLLNLIGGLDRPSAGQVLVNGDDLSALSPNRLADFRRDTVGFIFQFYNLIPSLTARENVAFAAELSHCQDGVDAALRTVGLEGRADHFPGQLSGGEQQRVSIARALVKEPALILCDEPTGALDAATGLAILDLLRRMVRDEGRTVLVVTHNEALAALATRLLRLQDGIVVTDERRPVVSAALSR